MGSTEMLQATPIQRRRSGRRVAIAIGLVLIAAIAVALAAGLGPVIRSLGGATVEAEIEHQRAKRRWLATWGLPMPAATDVTQLSQRLAEQGVTEGAPIFIRIFKREFELELWMKRNGVFHRFTTYPICRWSGTLGPKLRQGDHQTPEGFYTVDQTALNPNSNWFRSFNIGFPNAYDQARNRTGSFIMVHGGCASVGCFAMTNAQMAEIWQLVTAALSAGQKRFQVQVLPFRMSDTTLDAYRDHTNVDFWRSLKAGSDLFDTTLLPPKISVCRTAYQAQRAQPDSNGEALIKDEC